LTYPENRKKTLLNVDANTAGRMIQAIIKIPKGDIIRLEGHADLFRLRIGNWRVVFEYVKDITLVKHISPRGSAYNNL
jgi:mRNA-degrading endonuclease RelE of RelBE toxin-antitoxin system